MTAFFASFTAPIKLKNLAQFLATTATSLHRILEPPPPSLGCLDPRVLKGARENGDNQHAALILFDGMFIAVVSNNTEKTHQTGLYLTTLCLH